MALISQLSNPPINWRYWIVYYRHEDDRAMFFRGEKRNAFYIQNMKCDKAGDWTWEMDYARLFQFEPVLALAATAKTLGENYRPEILRRTNYHGFDGIVLRTHLILPHG